MADAVGFVEVYGLVAAFVAGDAGCKAANVRLEVFDRNKPANADKLPVPLIVLVKFRGSVADVREAVAAASEAAGKITSVLSTYVIANPERDTEKMLKISGLDKDRRAPAPAKKTEDDGDAGMFEV